ncbi:MAG: rane protein AbrB duplication [Solirubrobacterales bacterium]|nr:rane protein AbrB duplication [Solirubrobacterales bacterium]
MAPAARLLRWPLAAAGTLAGGLLLDAAGLPSSFLFAALLLGLAVALRAPDALDVPGVAFRSAQAVAGVTLGAYLQTSALRELAHAWLPVALVSGATLALSLLAGKLLARTTNLDEPTAALGLIAGGASGIVGMSGELGADDRLVAFMQYLRVLVVVASTPLVIALCFPGHHASAAAVAADAQPVLGALRGWLLTVVLALAGAALAARLRLTAGVLLGPMILTGVVVLAVPGGPFDVPPLLRETSFAVIGLQVGLRFTTGTIRLLGRLLLPVSLVIAALLAACFGLALVLDATTSASLLDSYLATTPGGLYAVLAVASGSGADTTFVVAVQSLRVVVMVLLAPLAVRWALGRRA